MKRTLVIPKTPVRRPWGGRRKNAGRTKLPTPVRKNKYSSKLQNVAVSRMKLRKTLRKVEAKLAALREKGATGSDEYNALLIRHGVLSQSLGYKSAERDQRQDVAGPSSSFQHGFDDLTGEAHSSSEEVCSEIVH